MSLLRFFQGTPCPCWDFFRGHHILVETFSKDTMTLFRLHGSVSFCLNLLMGHLHPCWDFSMKHSVLVETFYYYYCYCTLCFCRMLCPFKTFPSDTHFNLVETFSWDSVSLSRVLMEYGFPFFFKTFYDWHWVVEDLHERPYFCLYGYELCGIMFPPPPVYLVCNWGMEMGAGLLFSLSASPVLATPTCIPLHSYFFCGGFYDLYSASLVRGILFTDTPCATRGVYLS